MQLDMHVVVWTCHFFAYSVSEEVLCGTAHTHHTLTNAAMGVYSYLHCDVFMVLRVT